MSNDVSPEAMQTRIQQARREAENLKDRIKRKKDDLADGTREYSLLSSTAHCHCHRYRRRRRRRHQEIMVLPTRRPSH
jgi:hypothetical protein